MGFSRDLGGRAVWRVITAAAYLSRSLDYSAARCALRHYVFGWGPDVSVARRDSRAVAVRRGEHGRRSSIEPAPRLPGARRHCAGVRRDRLGFADPQQALEVTHGSLLRHIHLRISDSAVAGHLWARQPESDPVLCHCDDSYPAARRAELVSGGKAGAISQIPPEAKVVRASTARDSLKDPAHSSTVSTSATTLIAAYGEGSQPRSEKPKSPTVLDRTNATREPPASAAAVQRSHQGPPRTISKATANEALAWIRNAVPIIGICW